jgi:hypothetical protein
LKTLGGILMGIGILIAGLSGLCSLVLLVTEATSSYSNMEDVIAMILGFGGIPFILGLGMIFLGRHFIKIAGRA